MELHSRSYYVRELRSAVPEGGFTRARSRILWLPVNLAVVAIAMVAIARGWLPGWAWPLASVVIGVAYSGITFLAHETLHGAVVHGGRAQYAVGWIGFAMFLVSPTLWIAWHNRVHHNNSNLPGTDPDMYPTLAEYEGSKTLRVVTDRFALGGRRWTGILALVFGFTGQSVQMLLSSRARGMLTTGQRRRAFLDTFLMIGVWTALAVLVGPLAFLFVFVLPLLVANTMVMMHILTNHGLSPLTDVNDPLVNSLSVTVPRWFERITLGFGYHTEHHLFPGASTRHGPAIRELILARWPERYQAMPLARALYTLHRTARVYRDATTLIDPPTGQTWSALVPGTSLTPRAHAAGTPVTPDVPVLSTPLVVAD